MRCWKSARCCSAKHISKSKCAKHTRFGALLEVEMSKKCTPLWREARFEVKSGKDWGFRGTFGRSDVALRGRHKGFCNLPKVSKTWGFCSSVSYNHYTTLHSTTLQPQLQLPLPLQLIILHYTNYITLHNTQLHCSYNYNYNYDHATLHYTTLHSTTLHSITLHYTYYITIH